MNEHEHTKKQPTGDYEVGYCRPPKHTRWKKGQPGNAGGRKKRSNDLKECVERLLAKTVRLTVDGRAKRMTMADAIAYQTVLVAMKGGASARRDIINLMKVDPGTEDGWTIIDARVVLEEPDAEARMERIAQENKEWREKALREGPPLLNPPSD